MNDSKISVRYAKALFESAEDKGILDEVRKDMDTLNSVCKVAEFEYLLLTPVMKESQKCDVMASVLNKEVNALTLSLLNLVFHNGRELYIPAIARNFIDLYKKKKGIVSATITSAVALPDKTKEKISKIVQDALKTPIELETNEDEALLGGFVIRIEDQQYDASVASSLKRIKSKLLN